MVMTVPPPPPPPPIYNHMDYNSDSEENASNHSAELQVGGINDHRREEDRVTEAEKNERVQKQLKVRMKKTQVPVQKTSQTSIFKILCLDATFHTSYAFQKNCQLYFL